MDKLILLAGGVDAFESIVREEIARPPLPPTPLIPPPMHWGDRRTLLVNEVLSARSFGLRDVLLDARTHGFSFSDAHLAEAKDKVRPGLVYARKHATWWKRHPSGITYPCQYREVKALVEQPRLDGFYALFDRIINRVNYALPVGGGCTSAPAGPPSLSAAAPAACRPTPRQHPAAAAAAATAASSSPAVAPQSRFQLDAGGLSPRDLALLKGAAAFDSDEEDEYTGPSLPAVLAKLQSPPLDPNLWVVTGMFLGSNICPKVPFWLPLLDLSGATLPQAVPYGTMLAALRLRHPFSLFHVRVLQKITVLGQPYGEVRFACADIAASSGKMPISVITPGQWLAWQSVDMYTVAL